MARRFGLGLLLGELDGHSNTRSRANYVGVECRVLAVHMAYTTSLVTKRTFSCSRMYSKKYLDLRVITYTHHDLTTERA